MEQKIVHARSCRSANRSQAGTAAMLADNATLMRLRGRGVPNGFGNGGVPMKRLRVLGVPKKVACADGQ